MKSAFRATVLAAALAACASGALAAPVVLDFEDLGKQALDAKEPIKVGTVAGFNFDGAYAYEFDMLTGADNQPDPTNFGGFLINRDRTARTAAIVVSLEELVANVAAAATPGAASAYPGQFFKAISFQLFTAGAKPVLTAFNATGKSWTTELTPGDGFKFWSLAGPYEFDALDKIERLEFSAEGAVLGLDNLSITLTDAIPGGGNVPEPASYALVGLALLAAGSASRRSRS